MTYLDDALDEWEKTYRPVKNHCRPDASWNGSLFETFGAEIAFVTSQPENNIWTWSDGEDGTYLSAGMGYINRIGYLVTEVPWTDIETVLQVDFYGETCDNCGDETDNGFGHFQDELGNDHPQAEDRLCTECFNAIMSLSNYDNA